MYFSCNNEKALTKKDKETFNLRGLHYFLRISKAIMLITCKKIQEVIEGCSKKNGCARQVKTTT